MSDRIGKEHAARTTGAPARLGTALAILLGVAAHPALARTVTDGAVLVTGGDAPTTMVRDATGAAVITGARASATADGAADWVTPRTAPRRTRLPRSFATTGSAHALRASLDHVDGALFRERDAFVATPSGAPFSIAGVGFPHVEVTPTRHRKHRRRYRRLLDWRGASDPHARVRCMNLPSHVVSRRAARYAPTVVQLATEHGLAPSLVMAVIARESCFDPRAVSRAGAIGLMQLMPATARELRAGDPRKPLNNLRAGIRYLAEMHELFGSTELALAAYNAGPGRVRRYAGIPPYRETRAYVAKVLAYQRRYRALELVASL